MNEWARRRKMVEQYREAYPPGTRIVLLDISETLQPVPLGMRGTAAFIDDMCQLHMKWDNDRTLAVIPGEDLFRKLTKAELAEEQEQESGKEHVRSTAEEGVQQERLEEPEGPAITM